VLHFSSSPSAASSRCVLLPAPVGHPYDATARSFRIRGTAPSPSLALKRCGPCVEHMKRSAVHGRPSRQPR
jgi:hypothetical protein